MEIKTGIAARHILLVEPDFAVNAALHIALTGHGYAVKSVFSQSELQDAVTAGGFDIVVVSDNLSKDDRILQVSGFCHAPIIVAKSPFDKTMLIEAVRDEF
jgi:DNA-binding response OmpR family regulator